MIQVRYSDYDFRLKEEEGRKYIFDELRKLWLRLTPEEWVRQNFIQYLIREKNYPATLIAAEKRIMLGELVKRFDVLIYDTQHQPWMMIECKSMQVPLSPAVLDQVLRYHISVPVPYLIITNGNECMGYEKVNGKLEELKELPVWK
jgi:hypothetical protein